MIKAINCKTEIVQQPVKTNNRKTGITAGLSQEATDYIDTAVARTKENYTYTTPNGYTINGIFDEYGLMPEDGMLFADGKLSSPLYDGTCEKFGDLTRYTSEDGRLMMETIDSEDEGKTVIVYYDSDGENGFDRTATYVGSRGGDHYFKKTQETFDADGDGVFEVVIDKDASYHDLTRTQQVKNPDYHWYTGFLNHFTSEKTPKYLEETINTGYDVESTTTVGVNADDLGHDDKYGDHFEFVEETSGYQRYSYTDDGQIIPEVECDTPPTEQIYIHWPKENAQDGHIIEGHYGLTDNLVDRYE